MAHKSFAVIGLGQFGRSVVNELVDNGMDDIAIDNDAEVANEVGKILPTTFIADSTDEKALRELGELIAKDAVKPGFAPNPMFNISYGLYVLTSNDGNRDNGCIINTFSQVANNPDRVMVCVNKANYTAETILKTKTFS